eukprot:686255-Pelagomonas_calceolata.AAC.1
MCIAILNLPCLPFVFCVAGNKLAGIAYPGCHPSSWAQPPYTLALLPSPCWLLFLPSSWVGDMNAQDAIPLDTLNCFSYLLFLHSAPFPLGGRHGCPGRHLCASGWRRPDRRRGCLCESAEASRQDAGSEERCAAQSGADGLLFTSILPQLFAHPSGKLAGGEWADGPVSCKNGEVVIPSARVVRVVRWHSLVIGVEPSGANAMALSLARGERVALSRVDAFADGVAVKQVTQNCRIGHVMLGARGLQAVGMETFRMCRELLDGIILVDNSAISAAIKVSSTAERGLLQPAFQHHGLQPHVV